MDALEKKADEHKNDGQGGKRKTTGKVHGCSDGGHAKGWCDTCQRSWRQMISCGDPLKKAAEKKRKKMLIIKVSCRTAS